MCSFLSLYFQHLVKFPAPPRAHFWAGAPPIATRSSNFHLDRRKKRVVVFRCVEMAIGTHNRTEAISFEILTERKRV